MKAYSLDLREKVVAAVDRGEMSGRQVAEVFEVSHSSVKRLLRQRRERGSLDPLPHGGGQKRLLSDKQLRELCQEVTRKPDSTLEELCRRVPGVEGKPVSSSTMCRTLARMGLGRKKKGALRL